MESILVGTATITFATFWVIVVIFYTPTCFRLRAMIELIDKGDILEEHKVKWSIGHNQHTVDNWLISIPSSEKYLKYQLVVATVQKLKRYRIIISVLIPILVISAIGLLTIIL
jgi:hypothetical protein